MQLMYVDIVKRTNISGKTKMLSGHRPSFQLLFAHRESLLSVQYVFFQDVCVPDVCVNIRNHSQIAVHMCNLTMGVLFYTNRTQVSKTITWSSVSEGTVNCCSVSLMKQDFENIIFKVYGIKLHCCLQCQERLDCSVYPTLDHLFSKYTESWVYVQLVAPE